MLRLEDGRLVDIKGIQDPYWEDDESEWIVHFPGPPFKDKDGNFCQRCVDCGFFLPTMNDTAWQPEEYVAVTVDENDPEYVEMTYVITVGARPLTTSETYCRELVQTETEDVSIY